MAGDVPAFVAGLDYSLHRVHIALLRGKDLISCAQYELGQDVGVQGGVLSGAFEQLRERAGGPTTLWMERPWVREGKGIRSALALHQVPARIELVAATAGFTVRYVVIGTWRAVVLGNGGMKTNVAKAAAINYVRYLYGVKADHNMADAICIATFGEHTRRMEAL